MAVFLLDLGTGFEEWPTFLRSDVEYQRLDNPEMRWDGSMSSVLTSDDERTTVRTWSLAHPGLTQAEAEELEGALNTASTASIAGDLIGETVSVLAEGVVREGYGGEDVQWKVSWDAIEV